MRKQYCVACKQEYFVEGSCPVCGGNLVRISKVHKIERFWLVILAAATALLLAFRVYTKHGLDIGGLFIAMYISTILVAIVFHENLVYEFIYKDLHQDKSKYYWLLWSAWIVAGLLFLVILWATLIPFVV